MSKHLTHLDAIRANAVLQQRLAKYLVLQCVRQSQLEDLHAGIAPSSATGDYADVTVTSPFGSIPWPRVSRFNDEEMKQLMIDVVDRTYQFLHTLFDEHAGSELLGWLAEHDPVPKWNAPQQVETR
jgi:ligand-binding SRPBCC domain-containing protein